MQTTPPHWQRNIAIFLLGQFLSGITSMTVQCDHLVLNCQNWFCNDSQHCYFIRYVADDFAESFCRALY